MKESFYVFEKQHEPTCWSCGHWVLGGGCAEANGALIPTEHDHHCEKWVKEGTAGTISAEMEGAE
ncbi:hypothetical protein [Sporosarcina sp. FA9]|uniref:hypothetical protein n=1 Tax=Sporosarcina sp. FA9 TaxID=3413030 RepID=UPI003F6595E4